MYDRYEKPFQYTICQQRNAISLFCREEILHLAETVGEL